MITNPNKNTLIFFSEISLYNLIIAKTINTKNNANNKTLNILNNSLLKFIHK